MIKVFFGEDRTAIAEAVRRELGEDYEVFEGAKMAVWDLPSVFFGASILETGERKILLKDVSENAEVWEKIEKYLKTNYRVVIWETKLDKRTAGYKKLKDKVEFKEFPLRQKPESRLVFGVLDTALRDGKKAVADVEKIEMEQDPFMFLGLLVTQALKRLELAEKRGRSVKERRILQALSKLDMDMKSSMIEPWTLVKMFLLEVSEI